MQTLESHPIPEWTSLWARLTALWVVLGGVGTLTNFYFSAYRSHPITWSLAIRSNVIEYGIWAIILTPIILIICMRFPLEKETIFTALPVQLLTLISIVALDVLIKALVHPVLFADVPTKPFPQRLLGYTLSETEPDIWIYLVVAVMGFTVAYYSKLRWKERQAAQLENQLVRAQLQILRMQLQPHFLFNTLHSIAALIEKSPRIAERIVCSLGDLLRMSLEASEVQEVTLRRELEFIDRYLDIQKVRFQDRLTVRLDVDDEVLDSKVPYLLLQPLLENAIKHGIARHPGYGTIQLYARRDGGVLLMSVSNDVPRSNGEASGTHRLGIGLENTRSRLQALYGKSDLLTAESLPDGRFRVEVRVPYRAAPLQPAVTEPQAKSETPQSMEIIS